MDEKPDSSGEPETAPIVEGRVHFDRKFDATSVAGSADSGRFHWGIKSTLALCGVLLLLLLTSFLWLELERSFPNLEPGGYVGVVEGLESDTSQRVYMERQVGDRNLFVMLFRPGFEPQFVPRDSNQESGGALSPLTVLSGKERLRFIGRAISASSYEGEVLNLLTGAEGRWRLESVANGVLPVSQDQLKHQAQLRSEIDQLRTIEQTITGELIQLENEYETLSKFISDEQGLMRKAQSKLLSERELLEAARQELKQVEAEGRDLESKLKLAERLTNMGRLVSMARESMEREARWADAVLRLETQQATKAGVE